MLTGLLLDTHVWFWYLEGSQSLQRRLRAGIDAQLGDCWLSPVSVWEVALLAERGRLQVAGPIRPWVEEALARFPLRDAPLSREIAVLSREVDLHSRDPADRFIAATTLTYALTLVTMDGGLAAADWLPTL